MGATTFIQAGHGASLGQAFAAAVEDARFERGFGGYSGSLAEKTDCVETSAGTIYPDLATAEAAALTLIGNDDPRISDKWGPAGAIEYVDASPMRAWLFFGWASS